MRPRPFRSHSYLGPSKGPFLIGEDNVDRFGIFVDAGYLYSASGSLLFGTTDRRKFVLNFESMVEALQGFGADNCSLEHLPTYWYDGARDATPTPQHVEVGNLPGVKLRLGRLTGGGQKGVDSRIVRDLIVLSTHRAISTAFLLGGDEDLREGMSEAQERGVQIALVGVEPLNEQNLSPTLAMEADDVLMLDRAFVEPHFRLRADDAVPAIEPDNPHDPVELGRAFGVAHLEGAEAGARTALLGRQPRTIPPEVDRLLLVYACRSLGVGRVADDFRRKLRSAFWEAIETLPE